MVVYVDAIEITYVIVLSDCIEIKNLTEATYQTQQSADVHTFATSKGFVSIFATLKGCITLSYHNTLVVRHCGNFNNHNTPLQTQQKRNFR
jgi:hypothetical protein